MQITPTLLLNKVKRKLGIKSLKLPWTDQELLDVLYEDTLPTFSIYFPYYFTMHVNLDNLKQVHGRNTLFGIGYHLDVERYGKDVTIIDVEDIEFPVLSNDFYDPAYNTYKDLSAYDYMSNAIMEANIESMMNIPITWRFENPDILYINEPGYQQFGEVAIRLMIVHAKDCSSINFTYLDYLTDLFKYDLKISLYEDMKHYDQIDATFAQIDLKISSWENAESDRATMIEKWDSEFLSHRQKTIYRV